MAYTVITKPTVGDAIKKSLVDDLIDNSDYLYDNLGGGNLVENGSFEQGTSPDDPTGWVSFKWGTGDIETTDPGHGKQGYKFTSTGSGGGYLTMADFAECSPYSTLTVYFFLKSSVADIKNIVRILWYKKDQTACTTASTDIYSDAATNPTEWTRYVLAATPPTDARYFKLRLIGADSSDATSGNCIFDGVGVLDGGSTVQMVSGYGTGAPAWAADRIYIDGVLAGNIGLPWTDAADGTTVIYQMDAVKASIAGGRSVDVTLRQGTTNIAATLSLTLGAGTWTIMAFGICKGIASYNMTAIAIRTA